MYVCMHVCKYVCMYVYIYRKKGAARLAMRLRREQANFVFDALDTDRTAILNSKKKREFSKKRVTALVYLTCNVLRLHTDV